MTVRWLAQHFLAKIKYHCDFFLLLKLIISLKGSRFESLEDIKRNVTTVLKVLSENDSSSISRHVRKVEMRLHTLKVNILTKYFTLQNQSSYLIISSYLQEDKTKLHK